MKKHHAIILLVLPVLMLMDGITTYVGVKYFDIPEGNPLMVPIAGTWQGIVMSVIFAILFFRMMLMDGLLGNMDKPVVKNTYYTVIAIYLLVQVANIYGIIKTATG